MGVRASNVFAYQLLNISSSTFGNVVLLFDDVVGTEQGGIIGCPLKGSSRTGWT